MSHDFGTPPPFPTPRLAYEDFRILNFCVCLFEAKNKLTNKSKLMNLHNFPNLRNFYQLSDILFI